MTLMGLIGGRQPACFQPRGIGVEQGEMRLFLCLSLCWVKCFFFRRNISLAIKIKKSWWYLRGALIWGQTKLSSSYLSACPSWGALLREGLFLPVLRCVYELIEQRVRVELQPCGRCPESLWGTVPRGWDVHGGFLGSAS